MYTYVVNVKVHSL